MINFEKLDTFPILQWYSLKILLVHYLFLISPWQDSDVTISGTKSVVKYTPKNEMDFGTLICWASNSVGPGAPPCVYHLLPIGPPEAPVSCSASNVTYSTVKVMWHTPLSRHDIESERWPMKQNLLSRGNHNHSALHWKRSLIRNFNFQEWNLIVE